MKKMFRSVLSCLLTVVLLLGLIPSVFAGGEYDGCGYTEEISLNGWDGENYTLLTPEEEPFTLYVEGCTVSQTEIFLIRVLNKTDGTVIRTFVRPDEDGAFSVCIHTEVGNKAFPTASKGVVVEDEAGGQSNTCCYDTLPGYNPVPEIADGFYRVVITRATTQNQADSVYDGDWWEGDNPLGGALGYACKEFVVEMTDNDPRVVNYTDIRDHNASVRSLNAELTEGSYAYLEYTDTYLKDIEWVMDTTGTTHPMTGEKVAFIKSVADQITAPASSDYEKVRLIYEFLSDHFYYDYYAFLNDTKRQYCNPYDNLTRLFEQTDSVNSAGGKVATVCNGFASLVIALARAEGIPARMARGYHIDGGATMWSDSMFYTTEINHWWSEVYVDGRWIMVDANNGCQNMWRRSGWDDISDEAWVKGDVRSYSGFDMTEDALANNYYYADFYSGYKELPPPCITMVDTSSGNVVIRWDVVPGADTYYVYRGTSDGKLSYLGYAASATPTQYISDTEEPETTYYYRVRAVKDKVEGTSSNMFTVRLTTDQWEQRGKAAIITHPQSTTAKSGQTATFTVWALGNELSYRWQFCKAGESIWSNSSADGSTSDTLRITAKESRDGQRYRCVVTDSQGNKAISDAAVLTVEQADLAITAQPQSVSAALGDTAQFSVNASGAGLSYQWQFCKDDKWENSGMTGNKTDTLSVPATVARNGQKYRCIVKNTGGDTVTSDAATLTVKTVITAQPGGTEAPVGDTALFTVKASGVGLSYQWQFCRDGKWENSGMTGNRTAALSVPVTAARNGQKYRCIVKDANGKTVTSDAAELTVKTVITAQPKAGKGVIGETVKFTVEASGAGLTYQWQFYKDGKWQNSGMTGNKTAALSVPVTAARNGQKYRCIVKDANGKTVTSDVAKLTVSTVITSQPGSVTAKVGETIRFTVKATGAGLTYQWQFYKGGKWQNSGMTGNKTTTLSVPVTVARDGQKYRCVITDANGVRTYSEAAKLTVK